MKISNLMKFVDKHILNHSALNEEGAKYFIFFDKKNVPYITVLKDIDNAVIKFQYGVLSNDDCHMLWVYEAKELGNSNLKLVATSVFTTTTQEKRYSDYGKQSVYLSRIELKDEAYAQRGIAKNMLKIIELFAINQNKKEICAFVVPYGFACGKLKEVHQFYKKTGFDKVSVLNPNEKYYDIYKYLKDNNNAKLKLTAMNYPTKTKDYTVIYPEKRIFSSHYKGVEKELNS